MTHEYGERVGDTATNHDDGAGQAHEPGQAGVVHGNVHRPRRAIVALLELALVALAVWGAFAAWSQGMTEVTDPLMADGEASTVRYHGNWIASAIGLATVAALLVLDALRQCMLALSTRRRL